MLFTPYAPAPDHARPSRRANRRALPLAQQPMRAMLADWQRDNAEGLPRPQ